MTKQKQKASSFVLPRVLFILSTVSFAHLTVAFIFPNVPFDTERCLYNHRAVMPMQSVALWENLDSIDMDMFPDPADTVYITTVAPIYITIGPPCCGKTEALRSCLLSDGYDPDDVFTQDVSLKDQSDVYHPVPVAAFLFPSLKINEGVGNQMLKSGVTVKERLIDTSSINPSLVKTDEEIRNVILRIAGRLTPQHFASKIRKQAKDAGDTKKYFQMRRIAVGEDLIQATEQVHLQAVSEVICQIHFHIPSDGQVSNEEELPYSNDDDENVDKNSSENGKSGRERVQLKAKEGNDVDIQKNNSSIQTPNQNMTANVTTEVELLSARDLIKTPYVDIFVPEAIFRGGALERANNKLKELLDKAPIDQPISWGNTNTRPKEYITALKAAEKAGRPVKFVAYGSRIKRVPRQELLRRNIANLRNSGRYLPAGAIAASLGRVEKLVSEAEKEVEEFYGYDEVTLFSEDEFHQKLDVAFASLAGFRMFEGGFVEQVEDFEF